MGSSGLRSMFVLIAIMAFLFGFYNTGQAQTSPPSHGHLPHHLYPVE